MIYIVYGQFAEDCIFCPFVGLGNREILLKEKEEELKVWNCMELGPCVVTVIYGVNNHSIFHIYVHPLLIRKGGLSKLVFE